MSGNSEERNLFQRNPKTASHTCILKAHLLPLTSVCIFTHLWWPVRSQLWVSHWNGKNWTNAWRNELADGKELYGDWKWPFPNKAVIVFSATQQAEFSMHFSQNFGFSLLLHRMSIDLAQSSWEHLDVFCHYLNWNTFIIKCTQTEYLQFTAGRTLYN